MPFGSLLLPIAVCLVALLVVVYNAMNDDLVVIVRKALVRLVRELAKLLLSEAGSQELIEWMETDVTEMVDEGGSGVLVAAIFLVVNLPHEVWKRRRSPKK